MEKFITRTIKVHEVGYTLYDVENKEIVAKVTSGFAGMNEKQIEKELEKEYKKSDTYKFLSVESILTSEKHYRMTEALFIQMAEQF